MTQAVREAIASFIYALIGVAVGAIIWFAAGDNLVGGIGMVGGVIAAGFGVIALIELARALTETDSGSRRQD